MTYIWLMIKTDSLYLFYDMSRNLCILSMHLTAEEASPERPQARTERQTKLQYTDDFIQSSSNLTKKQH